MTDESSRAWELRQHVELHRKLLLRKRMLRWAKPGAVYVPFIGDGDIADELYSDRSIFGADIDGERVKTAKTRFFSAQIKVWDCNSWPFAGAGDPFAIADFDAYAYPYESFRSFWTNAKKLSPLVLFFTDGERLPLMRTGGHYIAADGTHHHIKDVQERRRIFNQYLSTDVWPWFVNYIAPWEVVDWFRYLRGQMTYWAAVIRAD